MNRKMDDLMRGQIFKWLDSLILGLVALLTHLSIFVCYDRSMEPPSACTYGSPQLQLSFLFIIALFVFWRLRFEGVGRQYWFTWKRNWPLAIFIILALSSLGWTVLVGGTLYRALLASFLGVIAIFYGSRISSRDLLVYVVFTVGILALASLFVALVWPQAGITHAPPYEGLWRGVFWHKIYLGATMALGYIAGLVILFSSRTQFAWLQRVLAVGVIVLCSVLAVLSDSASGLMVFAIQTGLFILVYAWLTWGYRISRRGYWLLGGAAAIGIMIVLGNLDVVFSLFNRSATMTGRTDMWAHVLTTYAFQRPYLGHGFGAFWLQPGINQAIQVVVGWGYPVKVGDNGYLDVFLGLGGAGLLLLLVMLARGAWQAMTPAIRGRDLILFFPAFVLAHIIFINISLSYLVEFESFIWFLLVLVLAHVSKQETG